MPAPSPVLPSASTAPRCQIAFSALIPFSTTCRRGLPSIATTSPTPQEACSSSGWYSPSASSRANSASIRATQASSYVVMASLLAGGGRAAGLKGGGFYAYIYWR